MSTLRSRHVAALLCAGIALFALACWEHGSRNILVESRRFEVVTGSVLLGARQLLVDTATGDVWQLEGQPPRWEVLARGPEDVRSVPPQLLSGLLAAGEPAPPESGSD